MAFNVHGSSGNLIELAPATAETTWYLDAPNASTVTFARVSYSSEAEGKSITANDSANDGHNVRWSFGDVVFTGTEDWTSADNWSSGFVPGIYDPKRKYHPNLQL